MNYAPFFFTFDFGQEKIKLSSFWLNIEFEASIGRVRQVIAKKYFINKMTKENLVL